MEYSRKELNNLVSGDVKKKEEESAKNKKNCIFVKFQKVLEII